MRAYNLLYVVVVVVFVCRQYFVPVVNVELL